MLGTKSLCIFQGSCIIQTIFSLNMIQDRASIFFPSPVDHGKETFVRRCDRYFWPQTSSWSIERRLSIIYSNLTIHDVISVLNNIIVLRVLLAVFIIKLRMIALLLNWCLQKVTKSDIFVSSGRVDTETRLLVVSPSLVSSRLQYAY